MFLRAVCLLPDKCKKHGALEEEHTTQTGKGRVRERCRLDEPRSLSWFVYLSSRESSTSTGPQCRAAAAACQDAVQGWLKVEDALLGDGFRENPSNE